MRYFGYYLDYQNNYQKFSYLITHKAYIYRDDDWKLINGSRIELEEPVIIFFEKLFSRFLKTAYVDILNAEVGDLRAWDYVDDNSIVIIHKVLWRHRSNRVSYVVYMVEDGRENIGHLESSGDIKIFFSRLGTPIF